LFYAQNKISRASYLKAKRKKKNAVSSIGHMKNLLTQLKQNPGFQKQFFKILAGQNLGGMGDGKGSSPLQALANMDMNINMLNGMTNMGAGMNNRMGVGMTQPPLAKGFNNNTGMQNNAMKGFNQQQFNKAKPTQMPGGMGNNPNNFGLIGNNFNNMNNNIFNNMNMGN
jgi:hypothetical protein